MWCLHIICTYTCVFVSAHLHSFYVREKVCLHVCQGDVMAADVQLNCWKRIMHEHGEKCMYTHWYRILIQWMHALYLLYTIFLSSAEN